MSEVALGSILKPLIGTDEAVIDDKGRLLVSKKKRERLGSRFTMCLGDNGCIYAYPAETWWRIVKEMLGYEAINQGRQKYTRLILGNAEDELEFDPQGRVVVPRKLRELGRLQEKVLLVGCGDRLEVWAKEEYDKYEADPDTYGQARMESIQRASQEMRAS